MNKPTSILVLSVLSFAVSGCISHIGVTKVQPKKDPKGLRYYMPQPVIVGYPQPDGTITYEEKMLPDLEKEYAIRAWSFMAKYTAKITRTPEMFLDKAELKQDTTAVASKLIESSGNVGSAMATRIGEEKKAQREEAEEKEAKVATAKDNVTAKEQAVTAAELQLTFAKQDRDALPADADPAAKAIAIKAVTDAERAVEKAKLERQFARDAHDAAKRLENPAADAPAVPKAKRGVAAGPVIYRIVENPRTGGVSLEPMTFEVASMALKQASAQHRFDTVTAPKKPDEAENKSADAPALVHMTQAQPQTQVPMPAGVHVIVPECSVVHLTNSQNVTNHFHLVSVAGGTRLAITRKMETPAGEYRVNIVGKTASGAKQRFTRTVVVDAE